MARLNALPRRLSVRSIPPIVCNGPIQWIASTVYVVDPREMGGRFAELYERIMESGMKLVIYTTPSVETLGDVFLANRGSPAEVVLDGTQNDIHFLVAAIDSAAASLEARVRNSLAQNFERLRPRLLATCAVLFCGGRIPESAEEFATWAGSRPRTVHEKLRRAKLRGIDRLCMGARFARAWPQLCDDRLKLGTVAKRSGFGDCSRLGYACGTLVGESLRNAADLAPDEVAARIVAALRRPISLKAN